MLIKNLIAECKKFVSIEGCDGAGKSVLLSGLAEALGDKALITHEPGGTPVAEQIREVFKSSAPSTASVSCSTSLAAEELTSAADVLLVSAARAQHVCYAILPALRAGKIVVCDRFVDSTRVYQGLVGGVSEDFVETLIHHTTYGCLPSLTFLLDADPVFLQERMASRSDSSGHSVERFDKAKLSFHRNIRAGYLELVERYKERFCVLDACGSRSEILRKALARLKEHMQL